MNYPETSVTVRWSSPFEGLNETESLQVEDYYRREVDTRYIGFRYQLDGRPSFGWLEVHAGTDGFHLGTLFLSGVPEEPVTVAVVPEPTSFSFLLSGLATLMAIGIRQRSSGWRDRE